MKTENEEKNEEDEIVAYGFSRLRTDACILVVVSLIGILWGNPIEYFLFFISFSILRCYAGGYHADNKITCWLISIILLMFIGGLLKSYEKYTFIIEFSYVISLFIIMIFVPVDSKNRHLDTYEKKEYRIKALAIVAIEAVIILIVGNYGLKEIKAAIMLGNSLSASLVMAGIVKNSYESLRKNEKSIV